MLVEVTKADIEAGERGSCFACPIANALHRTGHPEMLVSAHEVYKEMPDGHQWPTFVVQIVAPLPSEAKAFVDRFDNALAVEPFSFELEGI